MNGNGNGNGSSNGRAGGTIVVDWITGLLGAVAAIIFIGFMAYEINVLPLWIIAIGVLIMMVIDIVQGAMDRSGSQG